MSAVAGPLVSVVLAVRDGERFLAQALESVLAQDHPRLEVVVVDDGSGDRSAAIAASYPVRLVRQPPRGVAAARNAGIAASSGELLAFVDADDVWLEGKASRQVAELAADPALAFCLTRMEIVLEPGTPRPEWLPDEWLESPPHGPVPSTWMVRRSAFERVGAFDTSFRLTSDADWLARAKDVGLQWTLVDEALVRYRVHGANGIYERAEMERELLRILRSSIARRRAASGATA